MAHLEHRQVEDAESHFNFSVINILFDLLQQKGGGGGGGCGRTQSGLISDP